jgi:hypothetical protein
MPCRSVPAGAYKLWVYMIALTQRYSVCKASNRAMADHFGVCLRAIQRWKRDLEAAGELRQKRRRRAHHREQTSLYEVRPIRPARCRPARNQMSSPNVTPSVPLRGAFCSSERTTTAAVATRPGKEEIEQVRADWGATEIDYEAIVRILVALAVQNCTYARFRLEAARRVREVRPTNRIGFVIHLAESGQIYGEPETSLQDQAAEIDRILAR